MGTFIIKADPDRDLYVAWSEGVGAPVAWGTRADMVRWLDSPDAPERLDRADRTGTSARAEPNPRDDYSFFGRWDYESFTYEQRGSLPRERLADAVVALEEGRDEDVWDMLLPFEDRMEVRRG